MPAQQKSGLDRHAAEPRFSLLLVSAAQRPKNSHSRMITGIGTPSSHNRIPFPIASSSICCRGENARCGGGFLCVPLTPSCKRRRREGTFYYVGILESDETAEWPLRISPRYQWPVFGIEDHGSAGGFGSPFCSSSIECRSGERTKAMLPSRGGRLMVMPAFISRSQVA
jgi:hypothetical protein